MLWEARLNCKFLEKTMKHCTFWRRFSSLIFSYFADDCIITLLILLDSFNQWVHIFSTKSARWFTSNFNYCVRTSWGKENLREIFFRGIKKFELVIIDHCFSLWWLAHYFYDYFESNNLYFSTQQQNTLEW